MLSTDPVPAPRRLLLLILGATLLPLAMLLGLGWRLLQLDRVLEREQVQQRVERGADLVVAGLQRAIAASQDELARGAEPPSGTVGLVFGAGRIEATPRARVAYLPVAARLPEPPAAALAEGEALEFRAGDLPGAIAVYRRLAGSTEPRVRAGAALALGRSLRKAGRQADAFEAYGRLATVDGIAVAGVPLALAAAYARGEILEALGRTTELRELGARLDGDLARARWEITGSVYRLYAGDASRWAGGEPRTPREGETLAAAAEALWASRASLAGGVPASEVVDAEGVPVAVVWSRSGSALRALLAAPSHVESRWLAALAALAEEHRVELGLLDTGSRLLFGEAETAASHRATRTPAATGLPWTVVAASRQPPPERAVFRRRGQLLAAGLALVALMALAASHLVVRSVRRELQVARLQADFVAAVSHEFRTPLTSLRQFTDMLTAEPEPGPERRRLAYGAQSRATTRLTRLVESLLDLARMQAGGKPYRFERVDVSGLVRRVVEDFGEEARAAGHAVEVRADGPVAVDADADALSFAVRNLLENAVKYSPAPGPVEVSVRSEDDRARIAVHDRGIGIPPEEHAAVFDAFRRGAAARTLGIRGTGVGLAIVDGIAKAHGGRVSVESAPGTGSTFTIELPMKG